MSWFSLLLNCALFYVEKKGGEKRQKKSKMLRNCTRNRKSEGKKKLDSGFPFMASGKCYKISLINAETG